MGRDLDINLADLPWPVSVLKFSQVVENLRPGDNMVARTRDADVLANLQLLLGSSRSG